MPKIAEVKAQVERIWLATFQSSAVDVVFGQMLSRDALNRVTLAAQSPLEQWRQRPISDTPPILLVDGVWVQILLPTGQTFLDRSGHERREMRGQEQVVLAVMGVWPDGRHQILASQAASVELDLHRLVRSTNLLERFFREFRAKTDEIGAFPNEQSCLVLFHLIVTRDDAKHDRGRARKRE